MIINGRIVSLRKITSSYEKDLLLQWRNKDRIRANMYNSDIITPEEHRHWIDNILHVPTKLYLLAYDVIKDVPIGLASIVNINKKLSNCEWAFYIGEDDYLNKGHAIEVEYLILKYVFEDLNFHRLFCAVLDFNTQVISFHKQFGFIEEGRYREYLFRDGRWLDVILLSILQDEYHLQKEKILKVLDKVIRRNLYKSVDSK